MEHKPRKLKDFLNENNSNSCSSNGFKSLPRKPNDSPKGLNSRNSYPGIWSKTRLTKSVFQTLLNAVKAISFTAVKKSQPSIISTETKATVKIKDIMRWKVCRDPAAEEPPSPATTGWSSNEWSWSESDSALSSWDAPNDDVADKEFSLFSFSPHGSEDSVGAGTGKEKMGNKCEQEVLICQKEEQLSPISVLQVGEDEFSSFDQTLPSIKRRNQNFMQHIQKCESLEQCLSLDENTCSDEEYDNNDDDDEEDCIEKWARELLHCVKATDSVQNSKANYDKLLLDIFKDELNARSNQTRNADEFGLEILRIAKDWIDGSFAYDIEHDNKEACIKDMDWRVRWGRFEFKEEQEELALEIETSILHSLVFELLGLDLEVTH